MDEMGEADREARHPIRVVARRTGVTAHLLRAWERRYAVVSPGRTEGGQRLYSDADIARLRLLRRAVDAGRGISQVAELSDAELSALVAQDDEPGGTVAASGAGAAAGRAGAAYLAACVEAALRLDYDGVYRSLLRGMASLRPAEWLEEVVGPLLHEVGERWHRGELTASHEHAVSVAVGRVLAALLAAYESEAGAPLVVTSTLSGEAHEFGAVLASVMAAEAGWRVLYLGPSLPAEEIARTAVLTRAAAVAVSVVKDGGEAEVTQDLGALRDALPPSVRLLAGGRGATSHAAAVRRIGGIECGDLGLMRALPRHGLAAVAS